MPKITDYPERTSLVGTEELVAVEGVDTYKITPETLRQFNTKAGSGEAVYQSLFGNKYKNYVSLTVAPTGGDFSNLADVFHYLNTTQFDAAWVVVNVQPGTYTLAATGAGEGYIYVPGRESGIVGFELKGTDRSTCIIETSGNRVFLAVNNFFIVQNLTFTTTEPWALFMRAYTSSIFMNTCNFIDYYTTEMWDSYGDFTSCVVTAPNAEGAAFFQSFSGSLVRVKGCNVNITDSYGAISAYDGGEIILNSTATTIQNATLAFDISGNSRIYLKTAPTLTNNTTNYPISLNQIQGDGSYITNGNMDILHKAEILSGSITKTLASSGGDFTTLTAFFDWIENNTFHGSEITLNVSAGTYTLSPARRILSSGHGISRINIVGSNKTTCFISSDMTGFDYDVAIGLRSISVYINNLTFNCVGGIPYLFDAKNANLELNNVNINDFDYAIFAAASTITITNANITGPDTGADFGIIAVLDSTMKLSTVTINNVDNSTGHGIQIGNSVVNMNSVTLTNCQTGIYIYPNNRYEVKGSSITFTSNAVNSNKTLNQIEGDGSYISTGTLSVGSGIGLNDNYNLVGADSASLNAGTKTSIVLGADEYGNITGTGTVLGNKNVGIVTAGNNNTFGGYSTMMCVMGYGNDCEGYHFNAAIFGSGNTLGLGGNNTLIVGEGNYAGGTGSVTKFFGNTKSFIAGVDAFGTGYNSWVHGCDNTYDSLKGKVQNTQAVMGRVTTNATPSLLGKKLVAPPAIGSNFGYQHYIPIPNNQTKAVIISVVAAVHGGTNSDRAFWLRSVLLTRIGGTLSIVGSPQTLGSDINPSGLPAPSITVNDTYKTLSITVTGLAATTITWGATITGPEIAIGTLTM